MFGRKKRNHFNPYDPDQHVHYMSTPRLKDVPVHPEVARELSAVIAAGSDLQDAHDQAFDLLDQAWGIIANAGSGDWTSQSDEWIVAAPRWRDKYFEFVGIKVDG